MTRNTTSQRTWGLTTGAALVLAGGLVAIASPAAADTAPIDPTTTKTVTADYLPTAQINGVVWDQEIVGNTVFVGGDFTKARPAGSALGVNEVNRTYLMSYNITTGAMTSWAPQLNSPVKELAVSPDGTRLYAAGSFTSVNGTARYRIAAFDTATGALVSTFRPTVNSTINAVTATNDAVVIGGIFTSVGGQSRKSLAALSSSGAVLPLTAAVAGGSIQAAVFAPDGQSVVIGGSFTTINESSNPGYGLARLGLATSELLPLPVNTEIRNGGADAAVLSLESDGEYLYGSGYHYGGAGNMEGSFAARWDTGAMVWVEDCHGDTYQVYPVGDVIYSASHKHYCGNSGGFPQTEPWTFHRATATTKEAKGTNTPDIYGYPHHAGQPRPDMLYWYPDINTGSFTGKDQGPWAVAGNSQYVVFGGEFTRVSNVPQQGLARFAVTSIAPNTTGPDLKGAGFPLIAKSFFAGQVRLSWQTNWDMDNQTLVYKLYRQSTGNVVYTSAPVTTPFWKPLTMSFTDTGLTPGQSTRYRLVAEDPFGNQALSDWVDVTVSSEATVTPYAQAVLDDNAADYWRLGEPSGATAFDWAGISDATLGSGVTLGATGAINGDPSTAATFNGTSNGLAATSNLIEGPQTFAIEAWFKTTTTSGGKIVGFGNKNTGTSSSYDRHVYMTTNGRVNFGVYPGAARTVTSSRSYNDGQWHQVVATLGSDGMNLFVDGVRVARRTDTTSAQSYSGYWRIGGDSTWSGGQWFNGQVDEVAIYSAPLTAQQVNAHWVASGRTSALPQAPADTYGKAVFDLWPDLYWRLGETGNTTTAADSGPAGNAGAYRTGITKGVAGVLSGVNNSAVRFSGSSGGVVASQNSFVNPTVYSEELWFKTTTTNGGTLIGFGSTNTSGTSSNHDRTVYMDAAGHLIFGTWTGQQNTTTTPETYNDGAWHHVVATQSSAGLALYVDGALRGTNPATGAENRTGYWRVGGDTTWDGIQPWFAGTVDEVAVYPFALSPEQVASHYTLGSGQLPPNLAPTAAFSATAPAIGLTVPVDGSASSDPEGGVLTYAWTFEDGTPATASGATTSVTFPGTGTYTVGLTVTDDAGNSAHSEQEVSVQAPPPNQPPTAAISATVPQVGLTVPVSGAQSTDPEGGPLTYEWTFESGTPATAATAAADVTFPGTGTYTIGLTVTDDHGLTNHAEQEVTVQAPPPNLAPTSSFVATVPAVGLSVSVDGSGSSDPESGPLTYAWSFESGSPATATGAAASVTFPGTGVYTVGLTVTDNVGETGYSEQEISVTAPQPGEIPANALAWDSFDRAVSNGWGSAQMGGAWTSTGTASQFAVNGAASHTPSPNGTLLSLLEGVSSSSTDVSVTISPDKVPDGTGTWVSVVGRRIGSDAYTARVRLQPDGTVQVHLTRQNGTPVSGGTVAGLTYGAGDQLRVRLQVESVSATSTALRVKVWKVGTDEPAAWTRAYTDSVAATLQAPGAVGLQTYLFSGVTNAPAIRFDDFSVVPVG